MAVFTAFSDESGAGDLKGWFLMGGYAASPDDWVYFSRAFDERVLKAHPKIPYLHMRELRTKQFRREHGMSDRQADDKVRTAVDVIATTGGLTATFSRMSRAELENALRSRLRAHGIRPQWDSKIPDYMCYIGYAYHMLDEVHTKHPEAQKVDFVVERNGKITKHIETFHEDLRSAVGDRAPHLLGLVGRLTPGDAENNPGLQAADVLLWHLRRSFQNTTRDRNYTRLCHGNAGLIRSHTYTTEDLEAQADAIIRKSMPAAANPQSERTERR